MATAKLLADKAALDMATQQGAACEYNKTLKHARDGVTQSREALAKFHRMRDEM